MSSRTVLLHLRTWLLPLAVLGAGFGTHPTAPAPVEVVVSTPVERPVTDSLHFTGRTEAVDSVELRARVTGYVDRVNFKEGEDVKKDQVLFEIDDRTFKAVRDKAQATVKLVEAQVKEADAVYKRDLKLRTDNTVSQEELEKAQRSRDSAASALDAAKADLKQAQLNLDYTKVLAPIDGSADKANVTAGNLVTGNSSTATVLTSIVTLQPIYVTFSVEEQTVIRLRQMIQEGKLNAESVKTLDVFFGVGRGDDYPYKATVSYIGNLIQGTTGTLPVRAVYPNKDEFLRPGLFARVRVPLGDPHPALLVREQALMTNQGQKYVHVINDQNEVVYRPVEVGPMDGNLRIITDGLKPGERIIIKDPGRVRPGMIVDPKPDSMEPAPAKGSDKPESKPAPGEGTK
jgi:RND family efflux transporter MFP subunit